MTDSHASIGTTSRLIAALLLPVMAGGGLAAGAHAAGDAVPLASTPLVAPMALVAPNSPTATPTALSPDTQPIERIGVPGNQEIEVNQLGEIAPDSIGILDPKRGGFGTDMWRGTSRHVVERMLSRLPVNIRSPSLRGLARRLLLSIATPPTSTDRGADLGGTDLLTLRIDRLAALGEIEGLNGLLAVVPSRIENEFIARRRVEGLLLIHQVDKACRLVRNGIAAYHQYVLWPKAMIFCQLAAGEVDRALLGLELLREQGLENDPIFFALAGALAGAPAGTESEFPPAEQISPLHLAMLVRLNRPLPPGIVERIDPGLLVSVARAPNADMEQRARAAERAGASGLIGAEELAQIYSAFSFMPDEIAGAAGLSDQMQGPRGRALLYQAARGEGLPAVRSEVLRIALERAEREGLYQATVPLLLPLLTEISAVPELAWFATAAGRALYAGRRYEQAGRWLMLARQHAFIDSQAAGAVAALWPYSRLAGDTALTTDGNLAAWRATREGLGDDALGLRQALLRASFQALGEQDPLPWSAIAANGEAVTRALPNAALVYALEDASVSRHLGETVLLSLVVLGEPELDQAHTMALSAVLAALRRVGLKAEARALAIEAALASGV